MPGAIRDNDSDEVEVDDSDMYICTIAMSGNQTVTMVTDDIDEFEELDGDVYTFSAWKDV